MNPLLQTMRNLGPMRLATMGGASVLVIGFFIYLMARISTPEMGLLYSDLDLADSGTMVEKLEELNVPFEVTGNGSAIMVPADEIDRVRVVMAQEGLPRGGSLGTVGNEIFDQSNGFGTTNFIQNINRLRALEGELARTIGTIENVRAARVHLVLPERELFSRDTQEPTASVFLQLDRNGLSSEQVLAIQHLVAAGVPKLQPQSISIIDDQGNLLARGPGASGEDLMLASAAERRRAEERRLKDTVEQLLSRSVGFGKVRAEISLDMDFDRITTNEERYDPDSQVARSTQLVEENAESNDGAGIDPVSVATNLPEADVPSLAAGGAATNSNNRTEETVNYEINRVVQNIVRETGTVRRLSVAVLVDGTYRPNAEGVTEYSARPPEEIEQLKALVRSAVGFNEARGDLIEIVNMPFVVEDQQIAADAATAIFGLSRKDVFRTVEMLVLAIVATLVILLVVRPVLTRMLEGDTRPAGVGDAFDGLLPDDTGGLGRLALAAPGMGSLPGAGSTLPATSDDLSDELDALIDISQVDGRVRASSIKKVGEIVEKHPEEAATIIRNWIYQET